jgi:hypothetical protein
MANLKIKLKGQDQGFEFYKLDKSFSVLSQSRGDVPEQSFEIKDDQLIELNLSDDTVWFGDNETLRELFPLQFKRSGHGDELFLPDEIEVDAQNRGVVSKIGIKIFKIFSKREVVFPLLKDLAKKLEDKQLSIEGINFTNVDAGVLVSCSPRFELKRAENLDASKPYLLFLHGTGSSTLGSFLDLKDSEDWKSIVLGYSKDSIIAFQHRTLTCSPLENVLELVKSLPKNIVLDLVSHSRGGLVADTLARFCVPNSQSKGFDEYERSVLEEKERVKDLELIKAIEKEINSKNISI